jgi:hypothetical protein
MLNACVWLKPDLRLKHRADLLQAIERQLHQRVFGRFVRRFVGHAETQERARVVPWHGDDRMIVDQVLARGFGVSNFVPSFRPFGDGV